MELKLGNPTPPNFKFTTEYALEEGMNIEEDSEYFIHRCRIGLEERLVHVPSARHTEYRERLEFEMQVINQMKYPGYMLIVWDLVSAQKRL